MPYFCFCNMNVTEDIYTEQDNLLGRIDLYVELIIQKCNGTDVMVITGML